MILKTPDGEIDVRAVQKRAAEDLRLDSVIVTDDIKAAIGLLATVIDGLEDAHGQIENLREIDHLRDQLRETMTY